MGVAGVGGRKEVRGRVGVLSSCLHALTAARSFWEIF